MLFFKKRTPMPFLVFVEEKHWIEMVCENKRIILLYKELLIANMIISSHIIRKR